MKNTILSVFALFLVMCALPAVHALGEVVDVNESTVLFNSEGDDSYLSKEEQVPAVGYITLTNYLNSSVTVKIPITEIKLDEKNKLNITAQTFTIAANKTIKKQLALSSRSKIEAGEYSTTNAGTKLQIVNDSNPTQVFDELDVRVLVPAIEVSSVEIQDDTGDPISDLKKGQKFKVSVEIKNIAENTDLENVKVTVGVYEKGKLDSVIENSDGEDLEDSEKISKLKNGDSKISIFEFEMPFDIDDGDDFVVLAEVTADGEDSGSFYAKKDETFSASVNDDELAITKFTVSPATLACDSDNKVKVSLELTNIGSEDEDVQLFLRNDETSFEKQLYKGDELEIDNDFSEEKGYKKTLSEYVILTDMKPGKKYTYTLAIYYAGNDDPTTAEYEVSRDSCTAGTTTDTTSTTTSTNTDNTPVVIVQPSNNNAQAPTTANVPAASTSYVTLKDISGFGSDWVVPTAIGVGGLLIGVLFAILLMPKP